MNKSENYSLNVVWGYITYSGFFKIKQKQEEKKRSFANGSKIKLGLVIVILSFIGVYFCRKNLKASMWE